MRIMEESEIRRIRRREDALLLRKLTFGTFYVVGILIAIKIAVMLWNDPMLITNLVQHYRSDSEMGCSLLPTRLQGYVMRDLLKMALTSLF